MKKLFTFAFILTLSGFSFGQASISGTVSDSLGPAMGGEIQLFTDEGLLIDTVEFISDGMYAFDNVPDGIYYISAKGDTSVYSNHSNTYYGQSTTWSSASEVIISASTSISNINITLIETPNWSGSGNTGYCNGVIAWDGSVRAGDPIPGVDIALEQIPGGIIKANTQTNEEGLFEVSNIPDGMTYRVIVDIPGLNLDSTYTVQVQNGDSALWLNFSVDSTTIYPDNFRAANRTISGTISDSIGPASAGRVKLFMANGIFVDSVDFINGTYQFDNVNPGSYYVITRGDTNAYPNHINTYYGQESLWQDASLVTLVDSGGVNYVDITLIQVPNWSGSSNVGYCSGTLVSGSGQRAGDPIPGIDIALEQIPGGIIKANTRTKENGFFEIKKIPNNTQYRLLVDIPGLPMDSTHTVTITAGDTVVDLDFIVDTSAATAGIYVASQSVTSIYSFETKTYTANSIFPNPSFGVFYLELIESNYEIAVYNINGKLISKNMIYSNKARIDLTNEPKGIYFVEISSEFGIEKHKVILE